MQRKGLVKRNMIENDFLAISHVILGQFVSLGIALIVGFGAYYHFKKKFLRMKNIDQLPTKSENSKAWYMVAIFLGIGGGLLMYFILKDDNPKMAKKGLIIATIIFIPIAFLITLALFL